jgi:phospholipid/cholesterol/gamma-HCH transport system substrate-binding protein
LTVFPIRKNIIFDMEKASMERKVGLFMVVGLVLLAVLLVIFSKGGAQFSAGYELRLRSSNVGPIQAGAAVLMAGYPVGKVSKLTLSANGQFVTLTLKINNEYQIRTNSVFTIEQSGFLGDQFVAIYPNTNVDATVLPPGAEVSCPPPFNLQQTARDASSFIRRIDETADRLNTAIVDVRRDVLNDETLTNFAVGVKNMRTASERALGIVDEIDTLIASNSPAVSVSASNFIVLSDQLNQFASNLSGLLATNGEDISVAVKNIESSTAALKNILEEAQAGKGLAGTLLRNDRLATNVTEIANNLSITTSNLNRLGLWGILWSHKPPRTNPPPHALESPRGASQ